MKVKDAAKLLQNAIKSGNGDMELEATFNAYEEDTFVSLADNVLSVSVIDISPKGPCIGSLIDLDEEEIREINFVRRNSGWLV